MPVQNEIAPPAGYGLGNAICAVCQESFGVDERMVNSNGQILHERCFVWVLHFIVHVTVQLSNWMYLLSLQNWLLIVHHLSDSSRGSIVAKLISVMYTHDVNGSLLSAVSIVCALAVDPFLFWSLSVLCSVCTFSWVLRCYTVPRMKLP